MKTKSILVWAVTLVVLMLVFAAAVSSDRKPAIAFALPRLRQTGLGGQPSRT
jgi:hypothetical protein